MPEEYDAMHSVMKQVPPNGVYLVLRELHTGKELACECLTTSGTQSQRFYFFKYIEFHKMIRKYLNF